MNKFLDWLGKNQKVAIVLIMAISTVLCVALFLGVDLSWLPEMLQKILGL